MLEEQTLHQVLRRGVSEIIVEEEFVRLLQEGTPLRLKMGFDPSRPDIHLGHVVGLRKLRQLQELGHKVILIVGDWTAQIGDPSGQSIMRPMLTHDQVMANAESYLSQFFKVVDKDRTETVLQSEWFGKFTLATVIDLTRRFTLAQFLERDDFARRFQANRPIALTEFLYPLLQAYDSVAIRSDVEFGGTDQTFNLLVGRQLQGMMGQRPQQCFLMPMLVGTAGVEKMSKSLDNYVAVDDPPNEMYGKIMSLPDNSRPYGSQAPADSTDSPPDQESQVPLIYPVADFFEYLTDVPETELAEMRRALVEGSVNPMELKKRLALEITRQFHGSEPARQAEGYFQSAFQQRGTPDDIPEVAFSLVNGQQQYRFQPVDGGGAREAAAVDRELGTLNAVELIYGAGLVSSRNEAKRLLSQGAVEVDQRKLSSPSVAIKDGTVIKVGRRRFARLVDLDKKIVEA